MPPLQVSAPLYQPSLDHISVKKEDIQPDFVPEQRVSVPPQDSQTTQPQIPTQGAEQPAKTSDTTGNARQGSAKENTPAAQTARLDLNNEAQHSTPPVAANGSTREENVGAVTVQEISRASKDARLSVNDENQNTGLPVATNDSTPKEKADPVKEITFNDTAAQSAIDLRKPDGDKLASESTQSQKETNEPTVYSRTNVILDVPAAPLSTAAEPQPVLPLADRLDGVAELQKRINTNDIAAHSGKRKRDETPQAPASGEPALNRPKISSPARYDRFANQRRSPSPVNLDTEDFRVVVTSDKPTYEQKSLSKTGRKSIGRDDQLPPTCTQDLECVFIGNIPQDAKDADIRPWLFSSRNLPRPVLVTRLASASGQPQYIRVFFRNKEEAEEALEVLKKTPFTTPPAHLLVRIMNKKPGKVKLFWRDIESWARPYLEEKASPISQSLRSSSSRP